MHLVFFLRGAEHNVNVWKILMQSQFFKWDRKDLKTGKIVSTLVQGGLRPSVLGTYEYVFPEEALPEVLSMLDLLDNGNSAPKNLYFNSRLFVLRKMLGCEKIPKKAFIEAKKLPNTMTIDGRYRGLGNCCIGGVSVHVIGIKKDVREVKEDWGFEQEML